MENLEFYTINSEVWYVTSDGHSGRLDENRQDIITSIIDKMMDCYPEAYKALSKWYGKSASNVPYFRWLIARRFVMCNFGKLDTTDTDCK